MKNVNNTALINEFCNFARNAGEDNTEKNKKELAMHMAKIPKDYADKHGISAYLKIVEKAFADGRPLKVLKNVAIIEKRNFPFANDFPFEAGDKVCVIRYEHGWMNGDMVAKIISREKNLNGVWSYVADVLDEDGNPYPDYTVEIRHTRDAFRHS